MSLLPENLLPDPENPQIFDQNTQNWAINTSFPVKNAFQVLESSKRPPMTQNIQNPSNLFKFPVQKFKIPWHSSRIAQIFDKNARNPLKWLNYWAQKPKKKPALSKKAENFFKL